MVIVVIALQLWLVLAASAALRPSNHWPFSLLAFPVGFAAGELPVQAIVLDSVSVLFLRWWGWPASWWGFCVLVIGCVVFLENLALIGVHLGARSVIARALRMAPRRPLELIPRQSVVYGAWWRTMLQIPLAPRAMVRYNDIAYGPDARHRLDVWCTADTPEGAPVLFYIHGGSWTFGDKRKQARPMLHEFVSQGWVVVTANYRFAPANPWPAQIEDAMRVLGWIKTNIRTYRGDPDRIVVSGGSAGGHLAALLALAPERQWRAPEHAQIADWSVRGCISFYGVLDMTGDEALWRGRGAGLLHLLEHRVVQQRYEQAPSLFEEISPYHRIVPDAPAFMVLQGTTDSLVDVGVARGFVEQFRTIAVAPMYYVELPLTQHAFDLIASPRTSAAVVAALTFANAVAVTRPALSPETLALFQSPPVEVLVEAAPGEWEEAISLAQRQGQFFIVTPENPYASIRSVEETQRDHLECRTELASRGWTWLPTVHRDVNGVWPDEHGYAIFGVDESQARGLAAYFYQHAFYDVTPEACRVVPTV